MKTASFKGICQLALLCGLMVMHGCSSPEGQTNADNASGGPLFRAVDPTASGLQFTNSITETDSINYYRWQYLYNGSGVAVGDINNDELPDIFLTGNQVSNRLFLNKGGLKFEDVTEKAGITSTNWSSGVTMADINGDGWLDIYVSRSGFFLANMLDRTNLLYINNKNGTFTESASTWGCNDAAFGTHATFLDYDLDGDLDLYTCNHAYQFGSKIDFRVERHFKPQSFESGRFFRNDGGHFTDITETCGVLRYAFSLSATAGDLNQDGYPDLYVANDFSEPDFLFINQKDGTFKDQIQTMTGHISNFSMGNDIADYNNDGLLDVIVLDMMAEDNRRKKTNMSGMNPDIFWRNVANGFHYQYMQNTLLLNQGNGWFSDVAQLAGISTTDWSWAPLAADFDNDGWQDLFITNGYRRDARDNDYVKKIEHGDVSLDDYKTSLGFMPEEKLANYMYRNEGDMRFSKVTKDWGLDQPTWSNGAAYADLDQDGDLDLIVCNLQDPVQLFENQAQQLQPKHWLRVRLQGEGQNTSGLGAKVQLKRDGQVWQTRELTLSRGYQSSVEPILHFGLGDLTEVEQLQVTWPGGKVSTVNKVKADQVLTLKASEAHSGLKPVTTQGYFQAATVGIEGFRHAETPFDDYKKEILIPHKMSQLGPALAVGDLDGDGRQDLYFGQALNGAGCAYLQQADGSFLARPNGAGAEQTGAAIFDADGSGKADLLTVSATSELSPDAPGFVPQLCLNQGQLPLKSGGKTVPLSAFRTAASALAPGDFDGDGDLDLFLGGRMAPGRYPYPSTSFLLLNDGKGNFSDVTAQAPGLSEVGMVTDAQWLDSDGDKDLDLLLVGEWMAPTLFRNDKGRFTNVSKAAGLAAHTGWWWRLALADLDGDGDQDFVAGNMGLNSKYPASPEQPFHIYAHDFDHSGSLDIVLGYYNGGECYPVRGRTCSSQQMPFIKEKFPTYKEFGNATLRDIYGKALDSALHYQATTLASAVFLNDGKGNFTMQPLPMRAQISSVMGIIPYDFDGDKKLDLLIAGNLHWTEVETSRDDAGVGLLLRGDGKGGFQPLGPLESGFFAPGDIKQLVMVPRPGKGALIIAALNDGSPRAWEIGGREGL